MKHTPRRRAVGIKEVARIAGVSTATVSRALSHPEIVSKETRRAVHSAIEQTGYTANASARNLRKQQTGAVVALAPNLANPFFSELLAGMSEVLHERHLNLIVADTHIGNRAQRSLIDYVNRSRADGLLVLDGGIGRDLIDHPQCPPIVQVCEEIEGVEGPRIVADNEGGMCAAVEHLVALGHRKIGHVIGPLDNSLTHGREAGFRQAMNAHELSMRDDWIISGDFSLAAGQAAARVLLDMTDRPTAMVCDNDEMACGLMGGLIQAGLKVPEDIAVVGFDDIELSRHLTPALTTVHQPRRRIGKRAAEMLLARIEGQPVPGREIMPVELVVRASTESSACSG